MEVQLNPISVSYKQLVVDICQVWHIVLYLAQQNFDWKKKLSLNNIKMIIESPGCHLGSTNWQNDAECDAKFKENE